jgi:uncharacterized protein
MIGSEESRRRINPRLHEGDEVCALLTEFARNCDISAASFSGIGASSDVDVDYFDWEEKDYRRIAVDVQVEVLGLNGDVARDGAKALGASACGH